MIKVLHVPFTFAPDPVGGTEIYVEALAQDLLPRGIESLIAAPSSTGLNETYEHNGMRVCRYRSAPESKRMLRELYGDGDPEAASEFAKILDVERPNVVHIHALTRAVSILLVRAAKQRGLPVFFTYHTPTVSCQRGTLMLRGKEVCDGVLDVRRCTDCSLSNSGLPRLLSMPLSFSPSFLAKRLESADLSGGLWTVLRMADLVKGSGKSFQMFMSEVDGIVALRNWVRTLLIRNGVAASKILLSPHGLSDPVSQRTAPVDVESVPLRVAYFGRADVVKGVDTLIKAVKAAPALKIELHLYGVSQSTSDQAYQKWLVDLAGSDPRIKFLPPVPHERVVPLLSNYHLLAVPSRWLETGPLVILEAFAAGTPVLGSNLGGIAEWVKNLENGLLVDFDDISAWTDALSRCASDRQLLTKLRKNVKPPRRMTIVADEMAHMYRGR